MSYQSPPPPDGPDDYPPPDGYDYDPQGGYGQQSYGPYGQPGYGPYGQPGYGPYGPYSQQGYLPPSRGTVILVLGILAWPTSCFILGIVAWAMGNSDLREIDAGRMDPSGRGNVVAGRILGMIHVIVCCVVIAVWFFLFIVLGFGSALFMH